MRERQSSADDKWGHDPSIQGMRQGFAMMEETQRAILRTLGMSPLDRRLRVWRENTLRLFEETWNKAVRRGSRLGERQVADLYSACFVLILRKAGISVPPSVLPSHEEADDEVARLMEDIRK